MNPIAIANRHVNIDCKYPVVPDRLTLPGLLLDCVATGGLLSVVWDVVGALVELPIVVRLAVKSPGEVFEDVNTPVTTPPVPVPL